jgi:hypothetical protein
VFVLYQIDIYLFNNINIICFMNNAVKYGIGLLGLAVTVYVVGIAWKRSQKNNSTGSGGFASAGGSKLDRIQGGMGGNIPKAPAQCLCGGIRRDCPCS